MKSNYNVYVFGGTGFIGRHLLKLLSREDRVYVKVMSRYKNKLISFPDNVQVEEGNLMELDSLVNFLEPDAIVINLAFLQNQSHETNIKAMENLARACVEVGVARLIHCSTAIVIGRVKDDVITEDTLCSPVTEYEKTKLEIENILLKSLMGKCEIVIVRPTVVFGEGGKNLLKLTREIITEPSLIRMFKISLFSRRRLNLVYVENVVAAIWFLAILNSNISGQCFIVSDDEVPENNYYDVVRILSEYLGIGYVKAFYLPFQSLIMKLLLRMVGRIHTNPKQNYSCEKIIQAGFKKPVSFKNGIEIFADWYKNKESGANRGEE